MLRPKMRFMDVVKEVTMLIGMREEGAEDKEVDGGR